MSRPNANDSPDNLASDVDQCVRLREFTTKSKRDSYGRIEMRLLAWGRNGVEWRHRCSALETQSPHHVRRADGRVARYRAADVSDSGSCDRRQRSYRPAARSSPARHANERQPLAWRRALPFF